MKSKFFFLQNSSRAFVSPPKVFSSTASIHPFEKNGYLSFEASSYLIPANGLEPGQKYEMYVEHAIFTDTQIDHGIPGFATLASSTYMSFNTLGDNDPSYCLEK